MLLHDGGILRALELGSLSVEPFRKSQLQASSIDLMLGSELAVVDDSDGKPFDVKANNFDRVQRFRAGPEGFPLLPHQFVLASSVERVRLGSSLAARVEGKSSLARLGVMVHSTSGFIDPGFEGEITLELANLLQVPIIIYPGMPVAQLCVFQMAGRSERPYNLKGKYNGQTGPTPSRYHLNFDPVVSP